MPLKLFNRITSLLLAVILTLALCPAVFAASEEQITVLFTHDLHSRFLAQPTGDGGESGGYARLKTALDAERKAHPDALVVDGGDFSIGSLIQTLYTAQAAELRTMGVLGYDVTVPGNHEFDHTGVGFSEMLNAAALSGDPVPAMVIANYKPSKENPDQLDIQRAMAAYGVKDYMLLERGGVTYGIFGILGLDSHDCAPTSGFELGDMAENAKRCVAALKNAGAEFIICLSHSGTSSDEKKSEDEQLAKAVDGIDMIVSGHTHTTLKEPILVGDTYIVSAGPYCRNLGSITLNWNRETGEKTLADYRLIPIDETVSEDGEVAALVESLKGQVSSSYLSRYGLTYDQVLTTSGFDMNTPAPGVQVGNNLGDLVSDAFQWAVRNLEKDAPDVPTVTVTADGVLRADLPAGEITTSMAFDVLSMGVGADGTSGFPLVGVYLTGKELKAAAEVDASVTPIMSAAQLYMSGIHYFFNTHRMFFNRVISAKLVDVCFDENCGQAHETEIVDDQLYRVVTGMYSAQMLGTVKSKSMGLLSLEPKMADGSPVTDFNECILYDKDGNEIKEWYALAAYLEQFGEDGVPAKYAQHDGRKEVSSSWNPIEHFRNLKGISLVVQLVIAVVAALVCLVARVVVRRKKSSRYGGGRKRRFGR